MTDASVYVVVGANGFLGSEIVRTLAGICRLSTSSRKYRIVALVRSAAAVNPRIVGLGPHVHIVEMDPVTKQRLVDLCTSAQYNSRVVGIFHVAGCHVTSRHPDDVAMMKEANVDLCNQVFSFAAAFHIKVVYSSCSGVVGCQELVDRLRAAHDDDMPPRQVIEAFPYLMQKADVEEKWRQEALKGRAPIVFLRPSALFGPGDERLKSTYVLYQLLTGAMKTTPPGGISFCDVRDCAKAFITAMQTAEPGAAMNITACNLPFAEFVSIVESTIRVKGPRRQLPASFHRLRARVQSKLRDVLELPKKYDLDPVAAEGRLRYWNVTCQRAKEVVDWDPREIEETIMDTAQYLHHTFDLCEEERDLSHATALSMHTKGIQRRAKFILRAAPIGTVLHWAIVCLLFIVSMWYIIRI